MKQVVIALLISLISTVSLAWADPQIFPAGSDRTSTMQKNILQNMTSSPHLPFAYSGLVVSISSTQKEPRAFIKGKSMTIASHVGVDFEFIKLFAHEMAHFVDIYILRSNGKNTDPSDIFYAISWKDASTKIAGEGVADFVSGYASTNKYEDFAESFVWYMFHNNDFADRAMVHDSLRRKYLFFQNYVFKKGQFTNTEYAISTIPGYLWDTTKIPIFVKKYLYSLL